MGEIVGAFGMSHVMFQPDGVEEQAERVLRGMLELRKRVRALAPDVLVLAGGDHFNNFNLALQVPLVIALSDRFRSLGDGGVPVSEFAGHRAFAEGLARFASGQDLDLAQAEEVVPDHGMAFPKLVLDPDNSVLTVLLYVNTAMPLPPSPGRCYRLGEVLRSYVETARPTGERVVVVGLGGLSHWLRVPEEGKIAEDFDRDFLNALGTGRAQQFAETCSANKFIAAAGNGGVEALSWLVAAGAAGDTGGEVLFYEPIVRWITGMAAMSLKCSGEAVPK
jgi:hypothetical protein